MSRHPFDPFSLLLGLACVALGLAVALGRIDDVEGGWGVWAALVALVVGVGLVPWRAPAIPDPPVHVPGSSSETERNTRT
jgi:hypothetical protein